MVGCCKIVFVVGGMCSVRGEDGVIREVESLVYGEFGVVVNVVFFGGVGYDVYSVMVGYCWVVEDVGFSVGWVGYDLVDFGMLVNCD